MGVGRVVAEYKGAVKRGDTKGMARAVVKFKDAVPPELIDACAEERRERIEEMEMRKERIFYRIVHAVRDSVRDEREGEIMDGMKNRDGDYYSELRDRIVKIADKAELVRERVNTIKKVMEIDRAVEWVGLMSMPAMTTVGIILEHVLEEIAKDEGETKTMKKEAQRALDRIAANFKR